MTDFSDMLNKAKAMQEKMKEAQDQIKKINQLRAERIERYRQYQVLIDQTFQRRVCDLLISESSTDE